MLNERRSIDFIAIQEAEIPDIPKIEGLTSDQVLTLVYCRSYKQYVSMIEGYRKGKCVFCDPLDPEKNGVIKETTCWRMWINPFPLKHTRLHLVMATRRHVTPGDEIEQHDFNEMGELFLWAQREFGITGGGFAMRFGSPAESSGSVLHLHANIIVPDGTGVVEVTLAKEPAKVAEQTARMQVFEKLRLGSGVEELSLEERALIEGRM